MALHPELGYFDEGLDLTDPAIYETARAASGQASILPPVAYRSRIFSELEDEKIWTRLWCCIGTTQQLADVGDLLPYTLGNHGIHVQREADGFVGRFNFAQHGGCRSIPAQCQTGMKTKCSYTSCGYSRDRDVVRIAEVDDDTPVLRHFVGDMPERMLPVRVDTWAGHLFVNVDQNAGTLAEQLAGLDVAVGTNFSTHQDKAGFWQNLDGNWKVLAGAVVDAVAADIEAQGGPTAIEPVPDAMAAEPAPAFAMVRSRAGEGSRVFVWVFPNLMIDLDGPWCTTIIIQPTGLDEAMARVRVAVDSAACTDAAAVTEREETWRARLTTANETALKDHRIFEDWGTPHSPETSLEKLPDAPGGAAYVFQRYMVDRLLTEYEYVWNAPLYTNARR